MRRSSVGVVTLCLVSAMAVGLSADVKSRQKTQVKFEGLLGRMVGMIGGKAAKEGVISTVSLAGDRQMTVTDQERRAHRPRGREGLPHRLQGPELTRSRPSRRSGRSGRTPRRK